MEFFAFADTVWDAKELRAHLHMDNLTALCPTLEKKIVTANGRDRFYTIWGEFDVVCQEIIGGYHFFMPKCQNSIVWTITTDLPPNPQQISIHATINRTEQDPDFVETLEDFVAEWKAGLEKLAGDQNGPR